LGPLEVPFVGVGHSMGACLTTMVQSRARLFDAVAFLGYGVDITNVRAEPHEELPLADRIEHSEQAFRQSTGVMDGAHYHLVPREALRGLFYSPSVPTAVVEADTAAESRVPVRAAAEVTTPGMVASFARAVNVPVFLGFGGSLDTSPNPHGEPANYLASADVTLYLLKDSAHCHNFASTRSVLWIRIGRWLSGIDRRW
jgi:pimeloyl-ACP methyl ester carboxylesterase